MQKPKYFILNLSDCFQVYMEEKVPDFFNVASDFWTSQYVHHSSCRDKCSSQVVPLTFIVSFCVCLSFFSSQVIQALCLLCALITSLSRKITIITADFRPMPTPLPSEILSL